MQENTFKNEQVQPAHIKAVCRWLITCNIFIFTMVIIGAITRLTESGLSMVEWKPLIGAIPPLSDAEWNRVFELYQQTPEFQKKNFWMNVHDFKTIFFWEWFHRLWGRLIGVIFAIPYVYFLIRKQIPEGFKLKLFGIFILGGLQGYMGWYMVQSGLVNQPAVSHYRLAAHLSLAFLIYTLILWNILDLKSLISNKIKNTDNFLYGYGWICLCALILTIFWGAYTAGLDAGLIYNDTFPMMGKTIIPEEIWSYTPLWASVFETHAGVQFMHRWLAMTTACLVISFALVAIIRQKRKEVIFPTLAMMVLIQAGLGIATLFSGVNIVIAVMHQGGALIMLTLIVMSLNMLRPLR